MRRTILVAAAGMALAARIAGAQGACDDVKRYFAKPPKLGEWAEMQMDRKSDEGRKPMVMRMAFVEKEERGGKQMYRLQMVMTQKDGQRQIMQMVTPWGPEAFDQDHDAEIVMKMGDQPAMVMPMKGGRNGPGMSDLRKQCAKIRYVGEEEVTVPAGTYQTRHYTGPDGDTWVSENVPGWRMVKMVSKDGHTMVLVATGDGAKNEITEKPRDMRAMMGEREMPGMKPPTQGKPDSTEEEAR